MQSHRPVVWFLQPRPARITPNKLLSNSARRIGTSIRGIGESEELKPPGPTIEPAPGWTAFDSIGGHGWVNGRTARFHAANCRPPVKLPVSSCRASNLTRYFSSSLLYQLDLFSRCDRIFPKSGSSDVAGRRRVSMILRTGSGLHDPPGHDSHHKNEIHGRDYFGGW